ncbi:hypothetical protein [Breznakia pachnodae]|uniref:Apea-like HEPN domain-containing protein n=1 Tax=Breznakia pachnodae TaxID=265178 RepID=A0ABU0E5D2_9FIRM|nr:hypothetical protein [Breznakia pachnodae]MDQ0362116.1 hypothetical protein [Breznakia pachnodae]
MKIDYIFFNKDISKDSKISYSLSLEVYINGLFPSSTENRIFFEMNKTKYVVNYSHSYDFNKTIGYLQIEIEGLNEKNAKVLSEIDGMLLNTSMREKYGITTLYDDSSNYFCHKLFKKIGIFERRIRQLIYIILFKTFNSNWVDETMSKDIRDGVKKNTGGRWGDVMNEEALNHMTFYDLTNFLTKPNDSKPIEILDSLDVEQISKMSENELRDKLYDLKPKPLWDELFSNYESLENLLPSITKISKYRNHVAHNKKIKYEKYKTWSKEIDKINKDLLYAERVIKGKVFELDDIVYTLEKYIEPLNDNSQNSSNLLVAKSLNKLKQSMQMITKATELPSYLQTSNAVIKVMETVPNLTKAMELPSYLQASNAMIKLMDTMPNLTKAMELPSYLQASNAMIKVMETVPNLTKAMELPSYLQASNTMIKVMEIIRNANKTNNFDAIIDDEEDE